MNREAVKAAYGLIEILKELRTRADALLRSAAEKEAALLSDDLQALKEILESEEDAVQEFEELEKSRKAKTSELIAALGAAPDDLPLRGIAEKIEDPIASKLLVEAGAELAEAAVVLREKNLALNEILNAKNDYANVMLEILTGGALASSRTYTENGGLDTPPEPGPGVVEFFA